MSAPQGRPEAIVFPAAGHAVFHSERIAPSPDLAPFVDYHWLVRWTDVARHVQRVVPQPRIHVASEAGRLLVHGINRETFERQLTGSGHVLGTAFHPAGFRPLLGGTVATLAGKVQPAAEVLGFDDRPTAEAIVRTDDTRAMVQAMEAYLRSLGPEADPTVAVVDHLVATAEGQPDIRRADQLATLADMSQRTLQRLFAEYVGVGPKWVIQRFRILDAARAAHSGDATDWAALAADLGFSDQSHLTRAFTAVMGAPPRTYERDARTSGRDMHPG